jgi:VWFA-related protein
MSPEILKFLLAILNRRVQEGVMKCRALLAAVLASVASPAWPQSVSAPVTGSAFNRRITLDVVVTDKSGNPVAGLQQQDFTILDDKRPQAIVSFRAPAETGRADDRPQRVLFVIDEVNVTYRAMEHGRQQLEKYLHQDGGQLPVPMSLVIFSEKSTQVQGSPTRNGNALAESVHAIDVGAARGNELGDTLLRLQTSLRVFGKLVKYEATQPGRKLLIWLGSGWPVVWDSADRLLAKEQETDFHILVELSNGLREGQVTAYSVDPLGLADAGSLGNVFYENFLDGVPSAKKFRSGDLALGVFAVHSGGLVLNRSNDVADLIAKCVDDTKSYYTLAFDSSPAEHPDEYHDLQIKIDKPGLAARTPAGYYAQP